LHSIQLLILEPIDDDSTLPCDVEDIFWGLCMAAKKKLSRQSFSTVIARR
jgi:hypothetical protein